MMNSTEPSTQKPVQAANKNTTDMTKGAILPLLLTFSLPLMAGYLFNDLYNLADMTIAGHTLGDDALAAISVSSGIITLLNCASRGFNAGSAISLSNAFGAGNLKKTKKSLASMFLTTIMISLLLVLLLVLTVNPLLRLVNTPESLFDRGYSYIIIMILGIPCTMAYDMFASAFRSLGNSRVPLIYLILCSVLNVILDYVFIVYFYWDVAGAAAATILSQLISAVLSGISFYRMYPELHLQKEDFNRILRVLADTLPIGLSSALTLSVFAIGNLAITSAVNALGSESIVAYAAYNKLRMFAVIPSLALANAVSVFAAQNYGAKQIDRVTKSIWLGIGFNVAVNLITCLILYLSGRRLIVLITNTDAQTTIEQAYALLLVNCMFIWAQTMVMSFRMSIQAFRYKIIPIFGTFLELLIRCGFAFLVIPVIGYIGIAYSEIASWLISGFAMMVCYYIIANQKKKLFMDEHNCNSSDSQSV